MRLTATLFLTLFLVISIQAASVSLDSPVISQDVAQQNIIKEAKPSEKIVEKIVEESEKSNEITSKPVDNYIDTKTEKIDKPIEDKIKEEAAVTSTEKTESAKICATKATETSTSVNKEPSKLPSLLEQGLIKLEQLRQVASETIQNTINPTEASQAQPATELNEGETTSSSETSFLQEAIDNLQDSFLNGIQTINQTFTDIFIGRPENTQSDQSTAPPSANIFQQGIQTIQQNFQNSITRLNETFYGFIQGSSDVQTPPTAATEAQKRILQITSQLQELQTEFQNGLKIAEEKYQSLSTPQGSVKASSDQNDEEQDSTTVSPSINPLNLFLGFLNSWQQSLQNSFSNLNSTVQNIIKPQPKPESDEIVTNKPNIFQQGLQSFQNQVQSLSQNFQNLLSGGTTQSPNDQKLSTTPRPVNPIVQGFQNISQNIQQGIQNIGQSIQNVIRPQESSASTPDTSKPGSNEVPTQTEVSSSVEAAASQNDSRVPNPSEKKVVQIDSKLGGGGNNHNKGSDNIGDGVKVSEEVKQPE